MEQQRTDLQQQRLATRIESVYEYARRRPGGLHEVVSLGKSKTINEAKSKLLGANRVAGSD